MPDEEVLPPPIEIPWKLASTTQVLVPGEPDETTISLFFFEPEDEELEEMFPDERLVYLKFTTSISPAALPPGTPPAAGDVLGVGVPCFHVRLDLKVRKPTGEVGTIRPYFHAAAPLYRRSLQTGVVGIEAFEGESAGQFMGKSRSQMYESSRTLSHTFSAGASAGIGIGPVSFGGSVRDTTTNVSGRREVTQAVDTTTREASQERRELVSHHTRVENLLTLLNAKYVGTPHLSFSLSPPPLTLLSADPTDPNLWFSQLLARRSSGIEGIQEFTTVVVVPRGEGFCVEARLRRVCVLDAPPGPLRLDEPFSFNQHLGRLMAYLDRAYPPGTPLEDFDLDLIGALPNPDEFTRPVLQNFVIAPTLLILMDVVSPTPLPFAGSTRTATINYKHMLELWLETLRDEYEREVAKSPLERGIIMGEDRLLDTCFAPGPNSALVVSGSSASVAPLQVIDVDLGDVDLGGVTANASSVRAQVRDRAFEAVTRWNLLENRLATLLSNRARRPRERPFRPDDPRFVDLVIEAWARLPVEDRRNLPLDVAASELKLGDSLVRTLKAAGARDLRTLAALVQGAPVLARYNDRVRERRRIHKAERIAGPPIDPLRLPLTPADAMAVKRAIAAALAAGRPDYPHEG